MSLSLAALTARRLRQERDLEGSVESDPTAFEPGKSESRTLPLPTQSESRAMMRETEMPDRLATVILPPLAAAPTVTFSGRVVRNGPRFALRETAGVLYPLDSAGRAWPYEGEDVRVTGKLDLGTRLLYVDDIERSLPSVL